MKDHLLNIFVIILVMLTAAVSIYNGCCNEEFYQASCAQVLTLLITLCIAFWATQYKNDQRKSKEHAERMLLKIQQLVMDESFYKISATGNPDEIKIILNTTNRKISNYIRILTEYGKTLKFKNQIEYINIQFQEYKTKVGEHIPDLDYLSKTESEFRKAAENIDSKCEDIIFQFYK